MSGKSRKWQNLILVSLVVLFVGLGCSLSNMLPLNLLPSPEIASPTATTAAPLVTPLPSSEDLETANALESQIIAVYEAVSPAVVNITSRSYTYDMFMRAVPQE
ncbi:MAG: hypothetical protein H5T62_15285, partial [Anaerolineae bacterium]|nr:hypothetical protein [Anaerolineae bacterium]